jgi:hypothetical protein
MPPSVIGENQGTSRSLARFYIREILPANQLCQNFSDRQEQRLRRSPAPRPLKVEDGCSRMCLGDDSSESFIPRKQEVQRFQLPQIRGFEWTAFVFADECSEPFPQAARLGRDAIELAGHGAFAHGGQHLRRHQPRLLEPVQKAFAITDPVDGDIDRGGYRIQEIQAKRVGNKKRGNLLGDQTPLGSPGK